MKLFSGTASEELSDDVSSSLNTPLAQREVVRFVNSEVRVKIEESVKGQTCVVLQSSYNPSDSHLMELFFFCDALKRQEADKVIGVIPYFGYARQDIQHRPGECVSVNVIIRFLESIGFDKIYTIDLHDEATEGVFSIPFKNLTALEVLAHRLRDDLRLQKPKPKELAVVSPDQGGIERARRFGTYFFQSEHFQLSVVEKKRNSASTHESEALDLYGSVDGKTVVLVDDIVTSGKTLTNAAVMCKANGAKNIYACVVHNELSAQSVELVADSSLERLFVTDTIVPSDMIVGHDKVTIVSVSELIASELRYLTHT